MKPPGIVADAFVDRAGSMTTAQLRRGLRAMVLLWIPDAARKRAQAARGEARVEAWQELSGNGALAGRELPAADMLAADARITAIARALGRRAWPGRWRGPGGGVLRAAGRPRPRVPGPAGPAGPAAPVPDPAGPGVAGAAGRSGLAALAGSVHLTLPAATWLGWSDAPGELPAFGPVDAWTARDLAGRWPRTRLRGGMSR